MQHLSPAWSSASWGLAVARDPPALNGNHSGQKGQSMFLEDYAGARARLAGFKPEETQLGLTDHARTIHFVSFVTNIPGKGKDLARTAMA